MQDETTDAATDAGSDADGVAEACERACSLAASGGLDVVGAATISFAFAETGDVTVTTISADGTVASGIVTAADMRAWVDPDARDSTPPPQAA